MYTFLSIHTKKNNKKTLARKVVTEVVNNYDYSQILDLPIEQLTGIDNQVPSRGIRSLSKMEDFISNFHSDNLFDFDKKNISVSKENRRFVRLPLNTKTMGRSY